MQHDGMDMKTLSREAYKNQNMARFVSNSCTKPVGFLQQMALMMIS